MTAHIPPLRFRALTRHYDAVLAATTRERTWRAAVLRCVAVSMPAGHVLDLGCGTGSLLREMDRVPALAAWAIGIDRDERALDIASAKLAHPAATRLVRADARRLPFADASFELAVSCLFFHHLDDPAKRGALTELQRVLRPGARLVVADWGRPSGALTSIGFLAVRLLDGFACTRASARGTLPSMIAAAGFGSPLEKAVVGTPLGVVRVWEASRN